MKHNESIQMQTTMMKEMAKHHTLMYTFDILILIGLGAVIALLFKILKKLRRK